MLHIYIYDISHLRVNVVILLNLDVHVTVHRDSFLTIKPTRGTNFSNLFLELNSTCFGQFLCPSSSVFYCTHSNGICHTGLLSACCFGQFLCPSSGVFHCTHSNGICHTGLLTACKLSAYLYGIYHCCVYSEKLLTMDRGTVRNP